jgi:hypothetical protein
MSTANSRPGFFRTPTGRMVLIVVGVIVLGFIAIQLIPVPRTNPPVVSEPTWDSPQTRALAQRACFDCHSNETVWPWYSYVAPMSWLVAGDVYEGRQHLNFSQWTGGGRGEDGGEMSEVILGGYMPPASYIALHPNARLTAAEKQQLVQGLAASLR